MCGRIALFTPPDRLARMLDAELAAGLEPEGRPSWNVGPQQTLFAVAGAEPRVLGAYRWGLVPSWAKDPGVGARLFNARGETVAEKPSFRAAFARRPCVVPVDGFYEWDRRGATTQPHYFSRRDGEPLLLAGLFELPRDFENTPSFLSGTCTVITTTPGADLDGIHDRMPVVLERDEVDLWLDGDPGVAALRLGALDAAPAGTLVHHAVSARVGNIRNNGADLLDPAAGSTS